MELTLEEQIDRIQRLSQYVQQNPQSTSTKLFSFLALLNAYIPEAYLLMPECQKILGPPDPIHGGPPFEERMEPFTCFINTSSPNPEHRCMIDTVFAQSAVNILACLGNSRSAIVKKFMFSLCGDQPQPHTLQFIKELLTKRKLGENGKEKFSRLIEDIHKKENFHKAVSVLETASDKLRQNHIFPQTVSRLYYIRGGIDYKKAQEWAKKAITRAPNYSHAADTLGQIYKNRLMREANRQEDILHMATEAFKAFKDVERKADKEEGPEMKDTAGTVSISNSFNNRGHFGFIQVAKTAFEKLNKVRSYPSQRHSSFIQKWKREVEAKFDFFEWYLVYSKPDMTSLEPYYFWKDIVLCYELYTTKTAAKSTSFPGLLDGLNHGLFTSKGRRAGFEEPEETVSDLEAIHDRLKTIYEANVDDVKVAERYILSNIILSNKMHNSLTPVKELQAIIYRFLGTEVGCRSSEFYLLVLLLFWPEEEPWVVQEEDDEEVEQTATEDDESEDKTWVDEDSNEEQETRGEPAQLSLDLMFDPDLQEHVTFMKKAFERAEYAKYLRGRYLLPLFFLGTGSGLSKWIHKSRLDAIVEKKVDAELADDHDKRAKKKWKRINEMWINGDVWRVPEIQDMLLPIQVELCHSPNMPQDHGKEQVFICVGGKKIMATTEVEQPEAPVLSPMLFYLGFTIQGPVVFKVG
ncbi:sterile alpha motif domain-containing protein 9-like isoform X2 [Sander vitreus]